MSTDVQGRALAVLNRVAQADWPDRFNLRKPFEKLLYSGSRTGFRLASERSAKQAKGPRKADPDGLFDLSFSDDQQMLVDMLEGFALEVLRPLAHDADAEASLPAELLNQALELGLTHYGVGEVHGGMAGERTTVTTALIAEALAKGDLTLAAALLVPLSAANCIRRWGSPSQQAQWLPAFVSEEGAPLTAIAVNEPSLLFDPQKLATRARRKGSHYLLSGEKCLVLRGLEASRLIVAAKTDEGPALFLVEASAKGIERRAEPAMGLKAGGTARLRLKSVKVPADNRLAAEHFDYRAFLDHAALAWCALALGRAGGAGLRDRLLQRARGLRRADQPSPGGRLHGRRHRHRTGRHAPDGLARLRPGRARPAVPARGLPGASAVRREGDEDRHRRRATARRPRLHQGASGRALVPRPARGSADGRRPAPVNPSECAVRRDE